MTGPSAPRASVILPVRNAAQHLRASITSLKWQTFRDFEVVVIDDASSDGTFDIVRTLTGDDSRFRYVRGGEHRGLASRLNQGIALSRGDIIVRMDADDVAYPDRLAVQVASLDSRPDIDLVGSAMLVFGQRGEPIGTRSGPEAHDGICKRSWAGFRLFHPTWAGKSGWFRRWLYSAEAMRCEDQELLLRSHTESRFMNIPAVLLGYREERIDLLKIFTGRQHYAAIVARHYLSARRLVPAVAGVAAQVALGCADAVAVGSGRHHRLARRRADPYVSPAQRAEWALLAGTLRLEQGPPTHARRFGFAG